MWILILNLGRVVTHFRVGQNHPNPVMIPKPTLTSDRVSFVIVIRICLVSITFDKKKSDGRALLSPNRCLLLHWKWLFVLQFWSGTFYSFWERLHSKWFNPNNKFCALYLGNSLEIPTYGHIQAMSIHLNLKSLLQTAYNDKVVRKILIVFKW